MSTALCPNRGATLARTSLVAQLVLAGLAVTVAPHGAIAQVVTSGGNGGSGPRGTGGQGGYLLTDGTAVPSTDGTGSSAGGGGGAPQDAFGTVDPGGQGTGQGGTGGTGGTYGENSSAFAPTASVTGADGGAGGSLFDPSPFDISTGGGGGGAGGYGALLAGTGSFAVTSSTASIRAGAGGKGGDVDVGAYFGYGGSGGDGGVGIFVTGNAVLTGNAGAIYGGAGGAAGYGSNGSNGNPGAGGAGIYIANGASHAGSTFTNTGSILAGRGGDAPDQASSTSSYGGSGGTGIVILGGGNLVNSGSIGGGAGGDVFGQGFAGQGGAGIAAIGSVGSSGGTGATGTVGNLFSITNNATGVITGGIGGTAGELGTSGDGGIAIAASNATIVNRGTISGGNAGASFSSEGGLGGVGIVGSDLTVRTSGTILGGTGANGTPADAIDFTGGTNRLILEKGFYFGASDVVVGFEEGRGRQALVGGATGTLDLGGTATSGAVFSVGTIGSQFIGFSKFEKIESGTWTLTGSNTDSLPWAVKDGVLIVEASMPNSSFAVGSDLIDPVIGGGGTLGSLNLSNGGVVAPGYATPYTTLHITGNVTFGSGSTYQVRINPTQTDMITAATATINNGSSVNVVAAPGSYSPSQTYTIVATTGGRTGTFSNLTTSSNLAFLQPTLTYTPNDVILRFIPNGVMFPTMSGTPNQGASSGGIQSLGPNNPLFGTVLTQTPTGAQQAFDATSGEPHASAATAGIGDSRFVSGAIIDRLWNLGGGGPSDAYDVLQGMNTTMPTLLRCYAPGDTVTRDILSSYSMWGQGIGDFGRNGGNGNAAALDRSLGGFIAGVDVPVYGRFGDVWRLGVAGGYSNDSISVSDRSSSGTYENAFGSLYAGVRAGPVDVRLGASYADNSTSLRRNVAFPGFIELERSTYGGSTVQGFAEFGYRFSFGRENVFEPVVGFTAVHLHQNGFLEKGGIAALRGFGRDTDVETTTVGFRAQATPFSGVPLVARLYLAWQHGFGDLDPTALVAFRAGGNAFKVSGAPLDEDAAVAEVGADYRLTSALSVGLSYAGQIGERDYDNAVRGRLDYRF